MKASMLKKALLFILSISMLFSLSCARDEEREDVSTTTHPLPKSKQIEMIGDESFIYTVYADYVEIYSYIGGGAVVNVPQSFNGKVILSIGDKAFESNTTLTKVVLPDTVINIEHRAFANCTSLREITMNGVKAIGSEAFKGSGLENIVLPPVLENLGKYALADTCIESCVLPASIIFPGDYAFAGCKNLTNVVFPATMTQISARMFYNCPSIVEVTLPENIKRIGGYAYSSCPNLKKIYIPESVCEIGEGLLYNSPNAVVITPKGSFAEEFCKTHSIKYETV